MVHCFWMVGFLLHKFLSINQRIAGSGCPTVKGTTAIGWAMRGTEQALEVRCRRARARKFADQWIADFIVVALGNALVISRQGLFHATWIVSQVKVSGQQMPVQPFRIRKGLGVISP